MEENAKIAAQKSGRLSFYVVNAIADGCTLVDCGESVSDCHTLYSTLEKAKAAMEVEIQECMKNFRHGEVKHDFERLYEFMNEDGQGFTVGIDEQIPQ